MNASPKISNDGLRLWHQVHVLMVQFLIQNGVIWVNGSIRIRQRKGGRVWSRLGLFMVAVYLTGEFHCPVSSDSCSASHTNRQKKHNWNWSRSAKKWRDDRKMCRYQSGFFWRHPLLDNYKYYWRIECVSSTLHLSLLTRDSSSLGNGLKKWP